MVRHRSLTTKKPNQRVKMNLSEYRRYELTEEDYNRIHKFVLSLWNCCQSK